MQRAGKGVQRAMRRPADRTGPPPPDVTTPLLARTRRVVVAASILWVLGVVLAFGTGGFGASGWIAAAAMSAAALGLVWAGFLATRAMQLLREETALLRAELHRLPRGAAGPPAGAASRDTAAGGPRVPVMIGPRPGTPPRPAPPAPDAAPGESPRGPQPVVTTTPTLPATEPEAHPCPPATFQSTRRTRASESGASAAQSAFPPETADGSGQMSLAGLSPEPPVELPSAMLIRALNFPDSDTDGAGFAALRNALADPPTARLIRAAQDVLTLLANDGIYMDELPADRARPDIWRRLAAGERGGGIAALGGVHDRMALARVAGRMRGDPVFRDTAHHFLRQFDRVFARFESTAQDAEIVAFADTRTARAFMLLARVAGLFD